MPPMQPGAARCRPPHPKPVVTDKGVLDWTVLGLVVTLGPAALWGVYALARQLVRGARAVARLAQLEMTCRRAAARR